jgi:hypothetical protein
MFRPKPAQKTTARPNQTLPSPRLILVLFLLGLAAACGSNPKSANSNSVPPSAVVLSISASLPSGTVGAGYSGALTVTGGTAPYTFSIASGDLPGGVQLYENSGTISGIPSDAGTFSFAVSVADSKGISSQKSLQISVSNNTPASGGSGSGTGSGTNSGGGSSGSGSGSGSSSSNSSAEPSFSNVQAAGGWSQAAQGPPNFVDCSPSPCNGGSFSMTQGVNNPSMSGNATEFYLGGSTPYTDILSYNHLIGPYSSQGLPDTGQSLVPPLHNFTYDVYFYSDNIGASEALEFDINQFFNGMGFIFGHQCRIANGNQWDVFDNQKGAWVPTGIPCYPKNGAWNHLTIQVQRTSDNHLTYQSITLNGQTSTLNWSLPHGSTPNWYGVSINFQMDGNSQQESYKVYLDNLTFSYE